MTSIGRSDLEHLKQFLDPKGGDAAADVPAPAIAKVATDFFAKAGAPVAFKAISDLADRHGEVHSIDIDLASRQTSADAAKTLREVYQALVALKERGAFAKPHLQETVSLDMVQSLERYEAEKAQGAGKTPPWVKQLRKTAGLEIYRLFQQVPQDLYLHTQMDEYLRARHKEIPYSELERAETPPRITLREEHARKQTATLALLTDPKLAAPIKLALVERLARTGEAAAIPALARLADDPVVGAAAKNSIAAISRAQKMTIVFASMEVKPYAGTGGLSNVMSELPRALAAMGHRVIVLSPKHAVIDDSKLQKTKNGGMVLGGESGSESFTLAKDVRDGVEHYFIENDTYFSKNRPGIYTDGRHDYGDNAERYDFFGAAIPAAIQAILGDKAPDIIQLNDAHTASAAAYIERNPAFNDTRTVIAVHNLGGAYQGQFDAHHLGRMRFANFGHFYPAGPAEFYGRLNFLKLGMMLADGAITVSRKYMDEILTKDKGEGLHGVLSLLFALDRLWGNLNGIDNAAWNPENDPLIPHHFSYADRTGKSACKADLQKAFKLPAKENTPVIGVLARLTEQKGFDDIVRSIENAMTAKKDVQFVICGDGDPLIRAQIEALAKAYPKNVAIAEKFTKELEHLIYAGSDFFLMPSKFEPCGLPQMYALRYLTIPIVRAVGGLDESIPDYDAKTRTGLGFKFTKDLDGAIDRALAWHVSGPEERETLIRNAALADFSWEKSSALEQLAFYRKMLTTSRKTTTE